MKLLRISNVEAKYESMVDSLLRYCSDVDTYYLFEKDDKGPDNLCDYETIWFYVNNQFNVQNYPTLTKRIEEYQGETVNFNCSGTLDIYSQHVIWKMLGFSVPKTIKFSNGHVFEDSNLPEDFNYPFVISYNREDSRLAHFQEVSNSKEINEWRTSRELPWDYLLHELIDYVSDDGFYYGAQAYIIGEMVIPRSTRWSSGWYVSPTPRADPCIGLEMGSFFRMPNLPNDINLQILTTAKAAEIDIGVLDFSLTREGKVIPWGISTTYPCFTESNLPEPEPVDQIKVQVDNWNTIFNYLGLNYSVKNTDIWRVITNLDLHL